MQNPELKVIDLFAGCGGLSLGLEQAGFTPIFASEINKDALATYLNNRKDKHKHFESNEFYCKDIKDLISNPEYLEKTYENLKSTFNFKDGEIDLIAGGPPCQGFSEIGLRRLYSVDKSELPSNHLFQDMIFLIDKLNPKMFLFENVRGILFSKWTKEGTNGEIFEDVLKSFRMLENYRVKWSLVYAKDYGVPQNRPRLLLVGIRKDIRVQKETDDDDAVLGGFLPKPNDIAPSISELLSDLVDLNYQNGGSTSTYPSSAQNEYQRSLRLKKDGSGICDVGEPVTEHDYSKHGVKTIEKFNAMLSDPSLKVPEAYKTKKFNHRVLPAVWGDKGPSITACSLPEDYVHYCQPRILSVREWARLQMFPDWYQFAGNRTTGGQRRAGNPREGIFEREVPKYTQIGNAVPVKLAFEIGKHFSNILRSQNSSVV